MNKRGLHHVEITLLVGLLLDSVILVAALVAVIFADQVKAISPTIGHILDIYFDVAKLAGGFLLVALAVLIAPLLLYRLRELVLRPPELVIDEFTNASGQDFLDKMTAGLSAQMREEVINEGLNARRLFRERGATVLPRGYSTPDDWPLPTRVEDYAVARLEAGLKGSLTQSIAPFAHLIGILLPANGHRVSCTLQLGRAPLAQLGITAEITDLRGRESPRIHTFWL